MTETRGQVDLDSLSQKELEELRDLIEKRLEPKPWWWTGHRLDLGECVEAPGKTEDGRWERLGMCSIVAERGDGGQLFIDVPGGSMTEAEAMAKQIISAMRLAETLYRGPEEIGEAPREGDEFPPIASCTLREAVGFLNLPPEWKKEILGEAKMSQEALDDEGPSGSEALRQLAKEMNVLADRHSDTKCDDPHRLCTVLTSHILEFAAYIHYILDSGEYSSDEES